MWKFILNFFKTLKKEPEFKFYYDKDTEVIVKKNKDSKVDEWDVIINTYKDLTDEDFIKIMTSVKRQIN